MKSSCGLAVEGPNKTLTVAAMHMTSGIGYVTLCGMVEATRDGFRGSLAEMHSVPLGEQYYIKYHLLSRKYNLYQSLEMLNY